MPTVATVQAAIRSRLEANFSALPLRWQNETELLPDVPVGLVHVDVILDAPQFIAYGGGEGQNTQRVTGEIAARVVMPVGTGMATGLAHAESICAIFRGQRVDSISYGAAGPIPGDGDIEEGNYAHVATALIDLHFDSLG